MATLREIVYMVSDELKASSDDNYFNEEHIIFLLGKYRAFLLVQKYKENSKEVAESDLQTLCLELEEVPALQEVPCYLGSLLRSTKQLPKILPIVQPRVHTVALFYDWHLSYVPYERMQYTGYNRWLPNIIYATIGPDKYLYLKSENPQFLHLEKVRIQAIFDDLYNSSSLMCDSNCDVMDNDFPLEESLIPQLIQLTVTELLKPEIRPNDSKNDAADNTEEGYPRYPYKSV